MSTPEQKAKVKELLEGLSDLDVREIMIAGLRDWPRDPNEHTMWLHGQLGRWSASHLARRKGWTYWEAMELKEPFLDCLHEPWMSSVVEFLAWFVRAGFATPLAADTDSHGYPSSYRVTRRGLCLLEADEDHPFLPNFGQRLVARCPNLPDGIIALLNDARTCLDHMLMRPAVVLMGVAYDSATEEVASAMIARGQLNANVDDQAFARRIASIKAVIDNVLPGGTVEERDHRFGVQAAYDFADQLRRRRNDASHTAPTYGFEDREEIEELLVSAGRHLPKLWSLY